MYGSGFFSAFPSFFPKKNPCLLPISQVLTGAHMGSGPTTLLRIEVLGFCGLRPGTKDSGFTDSGCRASGLGCVLPKQPLQESTYSQHRKYVDHCYRFLEGPGRPSHPHNAPKP